MTAPKEPGATGRIRVAVVYGGRSSEHAISCVSAGSILRNLDPERFEVVAVGITPEGAWVLTGAEPDTLAITDGRLPQVTGASGKELALAADPGRGGELLSLGQGAPEVLGAVDVVFPVLHGPYGEDGTIQCNSQDEIDAMLAGLEEATPEADVRPRRPTAMCSN